MHVGAIQSDVHPKALHPRRSRGSGRVDVADPQPVAQHLVDGEPHHLGSELEARQLELGVAEPRVQVGEARAPGRRARGRRGRQQRRQHGRSQVDGWNGRKRTGTEGNGRKRNRAVDHRPTIDRGLLLRTKKQEPAILPTSEILRI